MGRNPRRRYCFYCLLPAKIKVLAFLKSFKNIFKIFLVTLGHILRPRSKTSIFQKMLPK